MTSASHSRSCALSLSGALALALVAPGCTLKITDFMESASDTNDSMGDETTGAPDDTTGTSEDTTAGSISSTTTADPSTTTAGDPIDSITDGELPACDEYTDDPKNVPGEACAEALGCAAFDEEVECQSHGYQGQSGLSVECRWGNLFTGTYDVQGDLCSGEFEGVCRAALYYGEGGEPCFGFYRELDGGVEVLNHNCATPIAGDFESCYVDENDPELDVCGCMPPWP